MLYETQFRQAIDSETGREDEAGLKALSTEYEVRRIREEDISEVLRLYRTNKRYYRYMGHVPTRESLTEVISRIEEAPEAENKYLAGFYDEGRLIAILDLITGYPEKDDAFIGWYMVDGELQGEGIGSKIFADVRAALKGWNYDRISLGCVKENEQAVEFWKAQGFAPTGEETARGKHTVVTMARDI
ncbi:MAG: GNAT family N-acetyltransferase, partial [Firmicutes bacterium]|nr:GNAT family N-acetyltransferase [Bacillota bacterium]